MTEQQHTTGRKQADEVRRRRVGGAVFAGGVALTLGFFVFFPGLPHVIDWGAVLVALAVGAVARWGWLVWGARRGGRGR
ncbi:hypothetical protein ACH4L5_04090 [Streptomyces sp. NPDC017405]|uniref:hypothetical protein n=1 Tax=unclassified Streptomyces TaxID=2593676 RepID=UPI00378D086B